MKHKHADVLNAIADGKIVQYKHEFIDWTDADLEELKANVDPLTFHDYDWRIKPETKPEVVKYIGLNDFGNRQWGKIESDFYIIDHWSNKLKLTFDGETGKLISAEVL